MTQQSKSSKAMQVSLWVAQAILAINLIWAAALKLFLPIEQLAAMWPWVGQVSPALVKFTGVVDLTAAIGLIVPALLRVKPKLTPLAAIGVVVLMLCAGAFHIARGEASLIGVNIVIAAIAAFVAWGRFSKAPIHPK